MDIEEIRKKKIEFSNMILGKILEFKAETSLRVEEVILDWIQISEMAQTHDKDFALGSVKLTLSSV